MKLNSNEIKEIIPHRYPFLLVDRIVELNKGENAIGIKNVSMNEEFYIEQFQNEVDINSPECKQKINDLFAKITIESSSFNKWLEDK